MGKARVPYPGWKKPAPRKAAGVGRAGAPRAKVAAPRAKVAAMPKMGGAELRSFHRVTAEDQPALDRVMRTIMGPRKRVK